MKATHRVLLIVLLALPATAQPESSGLPIGLDKLHWRMTPVDASAAYPEIGPRPSSDPSTNQRSERIQPYRWRDCSFDVRLYFATLNALEQLASVDLKASAASSSCKQEIMEDLSAHFGPPTRRSGVLGRDADWETAESLYAKEHEAEIYAGMNALERFNARVNGPHPIALYAEFQPDVHISLWGRGVPGVVVYDFVGDQLPGR
jgi:hypothetical protein